MRSHMGVRPHPIHVTRTEKNKREFFKSLVSTKGLLHSSDVTRNTMHIYRMLDYRTCAGAVLCTHMLWL